MIACTTVLLVHCSCSCFGVTVWRTVFSSSRTFRHSEFWIWL